MVIELSEDLERVLHARARILGVPADAYIREVLERELTGEARAAPAKLKPFKSSFGILAKYGPAPSAEEIDENRREMFKNFGEDY